MATVLFFQTPREWNRPVIVEREELFSSPRLTYAGPNTHYRFPGPFDVAEAVARLPAPFHKPSLIVCQIDVDGPAVNIAAAPGKKVLLLGDTHHGDRLSKSVKAAIAQPWDLVVNQFRGSHNHWFEEVGCSNVVHIPCFCINPVNHAPTRKRRHGITFVGQCSPDLHPRRDHVIKELRRRGYPVAAMQMPNAAIIHNESTISLNVSLNGDNNLRNYEVIAAGGTLLNIEGTVDQGERALVELLTPEAAFDVACTSWMDFWHKFSLWNPRTELMEAIHRRRGYAVDNSFGRNLWERIAAYEALQEKQRQHVGCTPLQVHITDLLEQNDASDLGRLEVVF